MGWSSGSWIMNDLIRTLNKHKLKYQTRKSIYLDMMNSLEGQDWDTVEESCGFDEAYDELYEELYGEEE